MFDRSEARRPLRSRTVLTLCLGFLLIAVSAANGQKSVLALDKNTPRFIDDNFKPLIGGITAQGLRTLVQADGKILVTGNFQLANGVNKNGIARYNADGSLDSTFNT